MKFPGLTLQNDGAALILRSENPLTILSSAVVGGGFTQARVIINRHVSKNYHNLDPVADMRVFAAERGIAEPFVGLMTAVYLQNTHVLTRQPEGISLGLVLTAGYSNSIAAGLTPPAQLIPGTINIILLIDARLSPAAMVNAVITATEAKTATLQQWGLRTPQGHIATGTSTDAVVVACTNRGPELPYAGPITPIGAAMAQMVRQGLALTRP